MKIDIAPFKVPENKIIKLSRYPTSIPPLCASREEYKERLAKGVSKISELQSLLHAHGQYSLLVILQGMDCGGKDSLIRHLFSGVDQSGLHVHSFKQPSREDLAHDYLWRVHKRVPKRGSIGVFNRSHYEEVLIVRVYPDMLQNQHLPEMAPRNKLWKERYQSINDFEGHLHRNGTRIVKLFLHLSHEEQRKRILERLDKPEKNWKFDEGDIEASTHWDDFQKAYEAALSATSTKTTPWYIIPADHKPDTRLIACQIILDTMRKMRMEYPKLEPDQIASLKKYRQQLGG